MSSAHLHLPPPAPVVTHKGNLIPWCIQLDTDERDQLAALARERQASKERVGARSPRWDPQKTDPDLHRLAVESEYAVARLLRLPFDNRVLPGGNKRGWSTAHIAKPLPRCTVDIVWRKRQGWDYGLNTADPASFRADVGVLVWPGPARLSHCYQLIGWTGPHRLRAYGEIKDFKWGDRWVLPWHRMAPIDTLVEMFRHRERMAAFEAERTVQRV